ncbi:DUF6107 family protein [Rhizobium paknamense]|uniref:MFS family arabinose efflux permease n=1 Tax=Rhizobium paknamense TaxID=1206817 RepID=A0ABU0I7V2_9HYPH|nr:DUF6107 family protein [Rhizobium paknamense]MDQ0454290.1 putative MFS family arabinose efflux permease [Rhizobium paknamense]
MSDFGSDPHLWSARMTGAVAGAAISLVYLLPRSRQEAASRFLTGVAFGMIFGGPTGQWLGQRLGLLENLSGPEIMLGGATTASLMAWWALGALSRIAGRFGRER